MHYLNYVNRLQERGLHAGYIKELTGVSIEPHKRLRRRVTERQLDVCLNTVKHDKHGLLRILEMFQDRNPNTIYRHINAYLQPFNAHDVLKELILTLIRDGVSIANINVLIRPLVDVSPSYSTLSHLAGSVCVERSTLSFEQRKQQTIELVKYINGKGITQDYRGYFLLRTLYPEVEGRVIAFTIVKSIDHLVKSCSLCDSEFLTASKYRLYCDKCRKKQRAV